MAFTNEDILNEVSKLLRSSLVPTKDGGVTDSQDVHAQLIDIAYITFLTNPNAIFYLVQLVTNHLLSLTKQEIGIIEDMLINLDYLERVGEDVGGTTYLSNASTALLDLDAASSVQDRPELERFFKNIDSFAEGLRRNVTALTGDQANPREEARNLIVRNLESLKTVHDKIISYIPNLRDLISNYNSLDIPTGVSRTAMTNIRRELSQMEVDINGDSPENNRARSNTFLLKSLASKAIVSLISRFTDPSTLKYRGPLNPIPSGTLYRGEVTGEGTPPSVITSPGPWELPISDNLELKTSETGSTQTVDLKAIIGATLNGRNKENFVVTTDRRELHVVVDRQSYTFPIQVAHTVSNRVSANYKLGFKHLGALAMFTDPNLPAADRYPRVVLLMYNQASAALNTSMSWDSSTNTMTIGDAIFAQSHVGLTYTSTVVTTQYFEIVRVIDANNVVLDPRNETPETGATNQIAVNGLSGLGGNEILSVTPALSTPPTVGSDIIVGPTVKTGRLDAGTVSAADAVADLMDPTKTSADPNHTYSSLYYHVESAELAADPGRVSISLRNKLTPFMQISRNFPKVNLTTPGDLVLVDESAHSLLGFNEGESDSDVLLTPSELVNAVNGQVSGVTAIVVRENVSTGILATTVDTDEVTDTSADFEALGVDEGHQIEIVDGDAATVYRVESRVSPTVLSLRNITFGSSEAGLTYTIFTEKVKIELDYKGPGSYLEVVTAPAELGISTGVVRGTLPTFQAVDRLGNSVTFEDVLVGDLLKVTGQDEVTITAVSGAELAVSPELPSNVTRAQFEISGNSSRKYNELSTDLGTYTSSRNLLPKNGFDESLDKLDAAIATAILPAQPFTSNLNQARTLTAELLSIMTDSPRRSDEYSTSVPTASLNLEDILSAYSAPLVQALESLLDDLVDRKYDRAANLLKTGDIVGFFETTSETASFGGAVIKAAKDAVGDLPSPPVYEFSVDLDTQLPVSYTEIPDADEEFDDTIDEPDYDI